MDDLDYAIDSLPTFSFNESNEDSLPNFSGYDDSEPTYYQGEML